MKNSNNFKSAVVQGDCTAAIVVVECADEITCLALQLELATTSEPSGNGGCARLFERVCDNS